MASLAALRFLRPFLVAKQRPFQPFYELARGNGYITFGRRGGGRRFLSRRTVITLAAAVGVGAGDSSESKAKR
jgi:hypothetical protein